MQQGGQNTKEQTKGREERMKVNGRQVQVSCTTVISNVQVLCKVGVRGVGGGVAVMETMPDSKVRGDI